MGVEVRTVVTFGEGEVTSKERLFQDTATFYFSIWVMVTGVVHFVKINQTVRLWCPHFSVGMLNFITKVALKLSNQIQSTATKMPTT